MEAGKHEKLQLANHSTLQVTTNIPQEHPCIPIVTSIDSIHNLHLLPQNLHLFH